MVELDSVVAYPRPAKLRLLQPLGVKANPGSIPPDDLDPVGPFGPEDIKRAVEGLCSAPHNRSYVSGEIMWRIRSCAGRGPSNLEFSAT